MQFGTSTAATEFASLFGEHARPLALTERAGDGAPAWFEPEDSIDLWAGDRPVSFPARPRVVLHGHAPASAVMAPDAGTSPTAAAPAPLVSVAAATPVQLPRPVVALVSEHDTAAPDAAVVTFRPALPVPAATSPSTPLVISA